MKRWTQPVLWTVWAVMSAAALAAIARWGQNVPLAEDWLMVEPLTGAETNLGQWLWAQNNEHRVPLPRLLYLLLLKATGGDFRSGMVFNACALSAMAVTMVLAVRRLRGGHLRVTDAFFPIAFLHLGHWENLVWGWQLQFVLSVGLTLGVLWATVRISQPSRFDPWIAGASLLLLPLAGANGLIMAVAVAPFVVVLAGVAPLDSPWGQPASRRFVWAAAGAALLLCGAYFLNFERASWNPPSPGVTASLDTAVRFLAMGFGPAAESWWLGWGAAAVSLTAACVALLLAAVRNAEGLVRLRAIGMLCFCGGMLVLALALGSGRAALVPQVGMPDRYALLALPLLCLVYFAAEFHARSRLRTMLQWGLLAGTLIALPINTALGFGWRNWYVAGVTAVLSDIEAGSTATDLSRRHGDFLMHWNSDDLVRRIELLRVHGIGPFSVVLPADSVPSPGEAQLPPGRGLEARSQALSR